MDADRPDSVTNDFKTNSETIGGNGVVAAAPLKAPANGSNVSASLANDNGCVVVDKTIGGIRQPQSVESHSDTILSNDVLSVSPAAAAAVANAAAAAAASDNDTNVCDPNGRFSSVMSDCNRTIKRQSFGMANGCAAVEVRVSSVLPSSVATAAPATVQNHSIETDRVSADDDVRDDAQTISQATTINGVHANQTAKDISYGNSKEQHQQQSANAFDSSEKNGSTAMYQRIPSDEEDADRKRAARTNGFMRTARRSPSTRNKKRTANGSAYNSLTHLDNDSDNEAGAGDRGSKHALYNEYVNLLCDADISTVAANDAARKRGQPNDRRHDGPAHGATENKPLLLDLAGQSSSSVHRKPKSIVKSPSFSSADRYFDGNRKPRLSIQCSGNDPERPVLHVQFLPNQTKSTTAMTQSYPPQMDAAHSSNVIRQGSLDTDGGGAGGLSSVRSSVSSTGSSSSDDSSSESSSSDEDSSIGQIAEAKPPDGGWGWVVVFASFMVNLIADGITFSFGVIYVEFLNYFGEGKTVFCMLCCCCCCVDFRMELTISFCFRCRRRQSKNRLDWITVHGHAAAIGASCVIPNRSVWLPPRDHCWLNTRFAGLLHIRIHQYHGNVVPHLRHIGRLRAEPVLRGRRCYCRLLFRQATLVRHRPLGMWQRHWHIHFRPAHAAAHRRIWLAWNDAHLIGPVLEYVRLRHADARFGMDHVSGEAEGETAKETQPFGHIGRIVFG